MDEGIGVFIAGILVALMLLGCLFQFAIGLVAVVCVLAAVFGFGIAANLALRYVANQCDWRTVDEDWIWLVIASLAVAPLGIGLILARVLPSFGLAAPLFFLWLAGYIWAWVDPRFEHGLADVLMMSTLITTWAKLQMWWECDEVRRNLS